MSALHALTAELHGGFLTLAFICIAATAFCQIVVHFEESMPKFMVRWAVKSRGYLDAAGFVAAVAGVPALLLSAYTGSGAWPLDALVDNATIRNKIELTVFATVLWTGIAAIRWRFGRPLWTCPPMAALYTLLAFVAMGVTGTAGSLGAHLTKGQSFLDFIWNLIGIKVTEDLLLNTTLAFIIAIASLVVLIVVLLIARLSGISKEQLGQRKCTRWSKWDEPTIGDEEASKK